MKKNLTLIFDDNCPLCTWYSGLFVKFHLLPASGRVAFTEAPDSLFALIDLDKAKNQIPLIDVDSKNVYYGIDALVEVLSQKFPFIKKVCQWQCVDWFLKKLYKLISYNRKVIVAKKCGKGQFDCSPEFNTFYRILFMLIFLLFNSAMLWPIHNYILTAFSYYHLTLFQLEIAHFLFVTTNCVVGLFLPYKLALEYLGQVNLLALCTVLLCIPVIFLSKFFSTTEFIVMLYCAGLTVFTIKEYLRRMRYAGIISGYKHVAGLNLLCLCIFLGYIFS